MNRHAEPLATMTGPTAPASSTEGAQTLVRGLALLRAFGAEDVYLGNKELSERTGLAKSTVSRLAKILVELGYLRYAHAIGKYALGTGVLTLAYPLLASLAIRQLARPFMKDLAESVGGQVSLGMASGASMVFIETSRSRVHRHTMPEAGAIVPILASSMGRAYLAVMERTKRTALLERLRAIDPVGWAAHGQKVEPALVDYCRLGFTRSFGDIRREMYACAVPLRTRIDGEVVVMNVSVPAYTLKRGDLENSIGPRLVVTARQIDESAGRRPFL